MTHLQVVPNFSERRLISIFRGWVDFEDCIYRVSINSFLDYKHLLQETLRCTSVRRVSAVDNFPTRWCTSTLGFGCSSVFGCDISKQVDWERCSDTLATTIAGYHPPWILFMGGMLRTKCFGHQFQILQIWRQEITDDFVTVTEDMLENTWREIDYRLDVLRATKGAHVEVYWCVVKKLLELSYILREKKCVCIPRIFLVINVCNQGKNLCSPCIVVCPHKSFSTFRSILSHLKAIQSRWLCRQHILSEK